MTDFPDVQNLINIDPQYLPGLVFKPQSQRADASIRVAYRNDIYRPCLPSHIHHLRSFLLL